ncbi:MAG: hypothetical protein ACR2LX_17930 [Jatrophihabitans sp.]
MGSVHVRGSGHPGDPFQVVVALTKADTESARAPESIVIDVTEMDYGADPQIRTVVVQVIDDE